MGNVSLPSDTTVATQPGATARARKTTARHQHIWSHPFVVVVLVVFTALVLLIGIAMGLAYRLMSSESETGHAQALIFLRIMQVTTGLLAGLVLIPIGAVLAWFGINGSVDAMVDGSELKGKLVTSSPGVLLFICGTILMHAAISTRVQVSQGKGNFSGESHPIPKNEDAGPPVDGDSPTARKPGMPKWNES